MLQRDFVVRVCLALVMLGLACGVAEAKKREFSVLAPDVLLFEEGYAAPLEPMVALLGAKVKTAKNGEISVERRKLRFTFLPEQLAARQNDIPVTLPFAPFTRAGATYLPLQPLVETLGGTLELDAPAHRVTITLPGLALPPFPAVALWEHLADFPADTAQLSLINMDGNGLRQLSFHAEPVGDVAISRDSRYIAYCLQTQLMLWDTTTAWPLAIAGAFSHPGFSPDGGTLLATRTNADGGTSIVRIRDGQVVELAAGEEARYSPDGRTILLLRHDPVPTLALLEADGGPARDMGRGTHAVFSPDGSQVLYTREDRVLVTYLVRGPNAGATQEPAAEQRTKGEYAGGFSAKGKEILIWRFQAEGTDPRNGVFLADANRATYRQVMREIPDREPLFTPDGKKIILGFNQGLFTVDKTGRAVPITPESLAIWSFTCTPDSAQILFSGSGL